MNRAHWHTFQVLTKRAERLLDWVLNIKQQCEQQNTMFYFKQWGGINKKKWPHTAWPNMG
jgi:protein gp37